jgi:CDP-glycerol glycerophosphotransferase (TagB/SpsB family)
LPVRLVRTGIRWLQTLVDRAAGRLRPRVQGYLGRRTGPERRHTAGAPDRPSRVSTATGPVVEALTSRLARLAWLESDGTTRLRIEGSAWRRGGEQTGSQITAVEWQVNGRQVAFDLQSLKSPAFNDHSLVPTQDRSGAGFVATLPIDRLLELAPSDDLFELRGPVLITVDDNRGRLTAPFTQRDASGSAGQLISRGLGNDCLAQLGWRAERGLLLTLTRRPVVARRVAISGTVLQADVTVRGGFEPVAAHLAGVGRTTTSRPLAFDREADPLRITGDLADQLTTDQATSTDFCLALADAGGRQRRVHWTGSTDELTRGSDQAEPGLRLRSGPGAAVQVEIAPVRVEVTAVDVVRSGTGTPRLVITGRCAGVPDDPKNWQLQGARRRVSAHAVRVDGAGCQAEFDLLGTPEWSDQLRPLPSAGYRILVDDQHGSTVTVTPDRGLTAELPQELTTPEHRVTIGRTGSGELEIVLGPPQPGGARSRFRRYELGERYSTAPTALTDAVLFTSFDGTAANDNPRAIEQEFVRRGTGLRRLWTVTDLSVPVPDGSEPVLMWTEEWWQALTSARFVVSNCWMPARFRRRAGQHVLQTWHGTPLKLLGYDRLGVKRGNDYRSKTAQEVAQWTFLIAQNHFSRTAFRSAYDYRGEILEIGYPRNDVLRTATDDQRTAVRRRLGIDDAEFVVLYTPTWREGLRTIFAGLDLQATRAAIGDRARILVRGHTNTVKHSGSLTGPGMLDVTMYPEVSDLYLISDLMITDYSSTMFDFSITGKPMIFFAPDLDDYTGRRRGTYFDLAAEAPGPVVRTTDELIRALDEPDDLTAQYADRYAAWQHKYNSHDDGHASLRAVDALLELG